VWPIRSGWVVLFPVRERLIPGILSTIKEYTMSNLKDKVADAGHAVADAAKSVGHKIVEGASDAAAFVKGKTGIGGPAEGSNAGVAGIRERMDVIASCGKKVGVVDHVEGGAIKLTRKDSPDGQHHFVPTGWVDHVDSHVHLSKNSAETESGWKSDAASCAGCGA
jgi:hypothetical protein